jgi:hypothetical protein
VIPFPKTVTVIRTPSQPLPTFGDVSSPPTRTDVNGCAVWPASTAEFVTGQDTVTWDLNCLLPFGTDVLSSDQVEVDGVIYQVVGRPQHWDSQLLPKSAGVEVQLKAGTG